MLKDSFEFSLIVTGITMMIYSSYTSIKIYMLFASSSSWFSFGNFLKKVWGVMPVFTFLSLTGYFTYFTLYMRGLTVNGLIVSLIFFCGAFLVMMIMVSNRKMFVLMRSKSMVNKLHEG